MYQYKLKDFIVKEAGNPYDFGKMYRLWATLYSISEDDDITHHENIAVAYIKTHHTVAAAIAESNKWREPLDLSDAVGHQHYWNSGDFYYSEEDRKSIRWLIGAEEKDFEVPKNIRV